MDGWVCIDVLDGRGVCNGDERTDPATRLAEEALGAAAHRERVVDVHVVVLGVRRLLHQGLVDLFSKGNGWV